VRYEHLVQINDPTRPDIRPLTRTELWRGLLLRAARPELFDTGIDATTTLEESETSQLREVRRAQRRLIERVELTPESLVAITAVGGSDLSGSRLEMRIEEPAPGALFVRFTYALSGPAVPTDEGERRALTQAYYFADLDTVRHIRVTAEDADPAPEVPSRS
jgi:hypothetical protein